MKEKLIDAGDLLRRVRTLTFDYAQAAHAGAVSHAEPPGAPVSCAPGCFGCCTAKIMVDVATGALIYLHLRDKDQWSPSVERALVSADRAMTGMSHGAWMDQQLPCVFLRGGRCTVYPVRPRACLSTFSKKDPALCTVVGLVGASFQVAIEPVVDYLLETHVAMLRGFGEAQAQLATLPGAVLYGRALVEGLPKPKVLTLGWDDAHATGRPYEELFDEMGVDQ